MADKTDAYIPSPAYPEAEPARESSPPTIKTPLVLDEYKFDYPRRGKCLIINNRYFEQSTGQNEREGTDEDAASLERVFMMLGFEVERVDNMTYIDTTMKMQDVAREDHSDVDCFVCIILSHGKEGYIYATNGLMPIDSITKHFKGDVCQSLAGKPKLFFIQACRGTKYDHGTMVEDSVDSGSAQPQVFLRKIPAEADFLVAYSVAPGHFSWRNNVDGSWFIQAISRVFQEHGDTMELLQMMTLVNKIVAYDFASCTDYEWTDNMKQVPCVVSMLTKQVFFRPKY